MNKKTLLIITPIIAIIIAALGILVFMLFDTSNNNEVYLKQIESARHSLEMGDTDQAIIYFKSAIQADSTQEEPYLKLSDIYYTAYGRIDLALEFLKRGYDATQSERIKMRITYYEFLAGDIIDEDSNGAESENPKGAINTGYAKAFSTYTYKTYSLHCTLVSQNRNNGVYTASYAQFSAVMEYRNSTENPDVVNTKTGEPNENMRPTLITLTNLSDFISGVENGGVSMDDLSANGAVGVKLNHADAKMSGNYLSFRYENCDIMIACDENGVISSNYAENRVIPPIAVGSVTTLEGLVVNADDNSPIQNVTVNIRKGTGVKTGAVVETLTASSGEFSIELEPGDYTVEAIAEGYITDYYNCTLPTGETVSRSFVMSPKLTGNQMRFVVEWTNTQYDLYIHIKGKSSKNESIQYWEYGNSSGDYSQDIGGFETGVENGQRYTSATITDSLGNYQFHVHGGKDQYSKEYLYQANVVVKIYKNNNSSPIVAELPASIPFDYWQVCNVHNGEITMID